MGQVQGAMGGQGTVRAAVLEGPGSVAVRTFPMPEPGPGAALLKVHLSGICGTDKHTYRGEIQQYGGTPHARQIRFPVIPGHENVGTIAAIGEGGVFDTQGRPLAVGDRVVAAPDVPCGQCYYCRNGYPYYFCTHLEDYGNSLGADRPPFLFGGWSEYLYLLPGTRLFRVPEDLPDEVAVFTEEMAVTHGLDTARGILAGQAQAPFGETVVVYGVGPLGLCHVLKARLTGASRIIAIDRLAGRLAAARDLGASLVLNVAETSPEERLAAVADHTEGLGADVVADCTGDPVTFPESLRLLRMGGVLVEAGDFVGLGTVPLDPSGDVCTKNTTILGIGGESAASYLSAMRLMAANLDRIPVERLITHRLALEQADWAVQVAQTDAAVKVVIDPWRHP
jgi:threonine dehydrogenase-like Zn-dependent dehydrogenase